jgi:phosphate:Na+ symporter
MQETLFPFVGGIGLFLIGMMLLSDGLVAFGGDAMKQALARFTGTPTKAFVSGTLATMVVQSSTATTVTLIGFVSAGLITFSQAIGVLIGASLGNTATGWIVASLGLKVNLGFYTLPLIGVGALLKLLKVGRWAHLGLAMAGFGLMFLGLSTLQDGMRGFADTFQLASLPAGGMGARMLILLIGLALTALLQSSTAAIATVLTALHTGTISMEQAAALVVGAAIGTTLTGALVAIGGTIHAKRTALAYMLFNLAAGLIAIGLLPLFLRAIDWLGQHAGLDAGATSLAAFHTLFIAVGVVLFLPFTDRFARRVERLLPGEDQAPTQRLDASMLAIAPVALEAAQRALEQTTLDLLDAHTALLRGDPVEGVRHRLSGAQPALHESYDFVSRIELPAGEPQAAAQRVAQLHAIDHLIRWRARLDDLTQARIDLGNPLYQWALENSHHMLTTARQGIGAQTLADQLPVLKADATTLAGLSHQMRHDVLSGTAPAGPTSQATALERADTFRWLERTAHHIWRTCHYLAQGRRPPEAKTAAPEPQA